MCENCRSYAYSTVVTAGIPALPILAESAVFLIGVPVWYGASLCSSCLPTRKDFNTQLARYMAEPYFEMARILEYALNLTCELEAKKDFARLFEGHKEIFHTKKELKNFLRFLLLKGYFTTFPVRSDLEKSFEGHQTDKSHKDLHRLLKEFRRKN